MQKLISVDLKSDFGFFRKPDANNTINLSYNMLHKPALLGILGAIIGLDGYKEKGKFPEYYEKLKDLQIGIEPLGHEKGNFQKTVIKYSNTVGYANNGSNYLTEEATLIKPSYRIYLLLELEDEHQNRLCDYLKNGKTEYIPYFGKNEFPIWWEKDSFGEYEFEKVGENENSYRVSSLFTIKEDKPPVIDFEQEESAIESDIKLGHPYIYFERLPASFDEELVQYQLDKFVYSNYLFKNELILSNLFKLDQEKYVQLH